MWILESDSDVLQRGFVHCGNEPALIISMIREKNLASPWKKVSIWENSSCRGTIWYGQISQALLENRNNLSSGIYASA